MFGSCFSIEIVFVSKQYVLKSEEDIFLFIVEKLLN